MATYVAVWYVNGPLRCILTVTMHYDVEWSRTGPDRAVQIFKVTGLVVPFFGWTVLSLFMTLLYYMALDKFNEALRCGYLRCHSTMRNAILWQEQTMSG